MRQSNFHQRCSPSDYTRKPLRIPFFCCLGRRGQNILNGYQIETNHMNSKFSPSKMAAIERRMVPPQDSTSFAPFTSLAASLWPTFLPIFSSREEKRSRHARSTTDDDPLELYSRWRIIIRRNLWPESYLFRDHSRSSQRIRQFPPFSWITK